MSACDDDAPDTVTLRVARVVYLMTLGNWYTTAQVAELTGLTPNGVRDLLGRMESSHHVPVLCVHVGPGRTQKWGIGEINAKDFAW